MHVDLTNWKILPSPSEKNVPLSIIDFWIESKWVLLCMNVAMEAAIYSMKNDPWDQQSARESRAVEKIAKYRIHYHLWPIFWGMDFFHFLVCFISKHFYWFLTCNDIFILRQSQLGSGTTKQLTCQKNMKTISDKVPYQL